jgi:glycosyltransferase involved in cell wall biosynthesis
VTCHGIDPERVRRTAATVRVSRIAVASCGEGPRRLLASHGVRSRVLDNAVPAMPPAIPRDDLVSRFGLEAGSTLVVSPARLSPQKDPATLVRALARTEGISALLVGGGPLEGQVRAEVARWGLGARVFVTDWLDDARAILAGADVMALSSRWEGQPTVVLEAMAADVAVVATACVGTRDTVVDGLTGLLAPVGDDVGLATALERARDVGVRTRLTHAARHTLASHNPDVVVDSHLAAYERLLDHRWS